MALYAPRSPARPFSEEECAELIRLWPSSLHDKEIAHRLDRTRGVFRRKAESLGLPGRIVARRAREADE